MDSQCPRCLGQVVMTQRLPRAIMEFVRYPKQVTFVNIACLPFLSLRGSSTHQWFWGRTFLALMVRHDFGPSYRCYCAPEPRSTFDFVVYRYIFLTNNTQSDFRLVKQHGNECICKKHRWAKIMFCTSKTNTLSLWLLIDNRLCMELDFHELAC